MSTTKYFAFLFLQVNFLILKTCNCVAGMVPNMLLNERYENSCRFFASSVRNKIFLQCFTSFPYISSNTSFSLESVEVVITFVSCFFFLPRILSSNLPSSIFNSFIVISLLLGHYHPQFRNR
jgi:hypothetical protein